MSSELNSFSFNLFSFRYAISIFILDIYNYISNIYLKGDKN